MVMLDLSKNDVGDDGASAIAGCITNIKNLNLAGCKLCPKGIQFLAEHCSSLESPVSFLMCIVICFLAEKIWLLHIQVQIPK